MIKKIVIGLFLMFILISNALADDPVIPTPVIPVEINVNLPNLDNVTGPEIKSTPVNSSISNPPGVQENEQGNIQSTGTKIDDSVAVTQDVVDDLQDSLKGLDENSEDYKYYNDQLNKEKEHLNELQKKAKADREKECEGSGKCLDQPTFTINISGEESILGGMGFEPKGTTSETINYTLGTIIQKLMIALGVLAVLIMTVGAGYIIMYHGQDELLSKGKSIFMSGITALVVALSSYYLVSILRYILYN